MMWSKATVCSAIIETNVKYLKTILLLCTMDQKIWPTIKDSVGAERSKFSLMNRSSGMKDSGSSARTEDMRRDTSLNDRDCLLLTCRGGKWIGFILSLNKSLRWTIDDHETTLKI
jgi:hypothetical protein